MVRRKAGRLLPLEEAVLLEAISGSRKGDAEFHGFAMAAAIQEQQQARRLTAHGTLYRALSRMEKEGWLSSRWEDPEIAERAGRPRRRLYRITGLGQAALAESESLKLAAKASPNVTWAPS